jgi:Fe-S-cluster containining protein
MPTPPNTSHQLAREAIFQKLEGLYAELQGSLPTPAQENPCGRCRECCTGQGLSLHNVTALEIDYLAARVGQERLAEFKRFLRRDGEVAVCPYFDQEQWGCGIYRHRPFSCRVFGHFRSQGTTLPEVCVFRGQEKLFRAIDYYASVPKAADLRELSRSYWPYQQEYFRTGEGPLEPVPLPSEAQAGDALDRALRLLSHGNLHQALAEFEASDLPSTPLVLYCLSLVFEGLGRHRDARTALEAALDEAPDCLPLWFRLACNLCADGQMDEAEAAFRRTLELNPDHALAHGLLGGKLLNEGRREEALNHLRAATSLEPESATFRRWLEQV